ILFVSLCRSLLISSEACLRQSELLRCGLCVCNAKDSSLLSGDFCSRLTPCFL
uniref:Uncharacterized protein n=1 Tax=Amphimedon queenslandica TaxID=400682 RepID=A0A1X7VEA9_AMPQE